MSQKPAHENDSIAHFKKEWARERPDLDITYVGIFARLYRISNRLVRRAERYLAPLGLTWEAFSMIVTLRRVGEPYELRPRDILNEGLLSSGAITNRIDRVEELGLVERMPDTMDRRSVILRLTPKGKELADKALTLHFNALEEAFSDLTKTEREQFADLLSRVLVSLEQKGSAQQNDADPITQEDQSPEWSADR